MNKVKLKGKVTSRPYYRHDCKLTTFTVSTYERCLNHNTNKYYSREDRHKVGVWGPTAYKVCCSLREKSDVIIEGAARVKKNRPWYNSVEASSVKVNNKGYYKDVVTGRF